MTTKLSAELLRTRPLPQPGQNSDKNQRGRVLVIGSSSDVPGAAHLSGMAALRGGAGKLQLAVPKSLAIASGIAFPESGIIALEESEGKNGASSSAKAMLDRASADCVLIGPGLSESPATTSLVQQLLESKHERLVLDAAALTDVMSLAGLVRQKSCVILTPNAGEMATLLGVSKGPIDADPKGAACRVAAELRCVVALKGGTTFVSDSDGDLWRNDNGAVGLGTAGSGDVLAGLIAGLVARGAAALTATLWGVFVHARIGAQLSEKIGPLGFLAREILPEIPPTLEAIEAAK